MNTWQSLYTDYEQMTVADAIVPKSRSHSPRPKVNADPTNPTSFFGGTMGHKQGNILVSIACFDCIERDSVIDWCLETKNFNISFVQMHSEMVGVGMVVCIPLES